MIIETEQLFCYTKLASLLLYTKCQMLQIQYFFPDGSFSGQPNFGSGHPPMPGHLSGVAPPQGKLGTSGLGDFRPKPLTVPPGFTPNNPNTPKPSSSKFDAEPVTSEHFLNLLDNRSNTPSSGYQSLVVDDRKARQLAKKATALQEMLNKPPTSEDCESMRNFLLQFGGRTAFKNNFKGPDSFFYCLARAAPQIITSSEP